MGVGALPFGLSKERISKKVEWEEFIAAEETKQEYCNGAQMGQDGHIRNVDYSLGMRRQPGML